MEFPNLYESEIAVIGMGYVGLPLAVQICKTEKCLITSNKKQHKVFGFDIDSSRIQDLKEGFDKTNEVSRSDLEGAKNLIYTNEVDLLKNVDVFIVTVPTPICKNNLPDLNPIKKLLK